MGLKDYSDSEAVRSRGQDLVSTEICLHLAKLFSTLSVCTRYQVLNMNVRIGTRYLIRFFCTYHMRLLLGRFREN